ncbi:MAG: hypothetical protein ACFBSG_20385 [Leptolyngbyaceae cyanobacterium]
MQQPPFHNPNADPLPDANDVEAEFRNPDPDWQPQESVVDLSPEKRSQIEADKRWLRNLMIGLLVGGLAIGGLLSIGLVWGLNQLDMVDPVSPSRPAQ